MMIEKQTKKQHSIGCLPVRVHQLQIMISFSDFLHNSGLSCIQPKVMKIESAICYNYTQYKSQFLVEEISTMPMKQNPK